MNVHRAIANALAKRQKFTWNIRPDEIPITVEEAQQIVGRWIDLRVTLEARFANNSRLHAAPGVWMQGVLLKDLPIDQPDTWWLWSPQRQAFMTLSSSFVEKAISITAEHVPVGSALLFYYGSWLLRLADYMPNDTLQA